MFQSHKRRRRQAVQFVDLVVGDALQAPSLAFVAEPRRRSRTRTIRLADGAPVCERCLVADSPLTRMRGLLGRRELPAEEGVLLRPAGSIHTLFMRFAIDVVFLDRDGRVLKVAESVVPWRFSAARGTRSVLELRAGEAARRGVTTGGVLVLDEG